MKKSYKTSQASIIVLPKKTRKLKSGVFVGNTNISTLVLNKSLRAISVVAFCGAINLKEVIYPGSREEFLKIKNWIQALHWTSCEYVHCEDGIIFVPDALIQERKLISVKKNAVNLDLEPDSYDAIAPEAFFGAIVKEVKLGSSVKLIPDDCFTMAEISKIIINKECQFIQTRAFDCSDVQEIIFENDSKPFLERGAISHCHQLQKIVIPGLFDILCIEDCPNLKEIKFTSKPSRNLISFAEKLPLLKKLYLPLSELEFNRLTDGLKMLKCIPDDCKIIFEDGSEIENAKFANSDGILMSVNQYLKDFTATSASRIQAIDKMAFNHQEVIETVELSKTRVGTIPYAAFAGCISLKTLVLPQSITVLEREIFWDTPQLAELTFLGSVVEWNKIEKAPSWADGSSLETIHCSDGDINLETNSSSEEN